MSDQNDNAPPKPGQPNQPGQPGQSKKSVQIQLDENVAQGVYTNLVLINHTENEFLLDFAFLAAGTPGAKVRSRIISTPRHTKRLLKALQQNIERYEARFGPIDAGTPEEEGFVH